MSGLHLPRAWTWLRRRLGRARLQLDDAQHADLAEVLRALGATVTEQRWTIAGAVERSQYAIRWGAARATMTCDSYQDPVVVGDAALIDAIAARLGIPGSG